jgi:hypothetical protein
MRLLPLIHSSSMVVVSVYSGLQCKRIILLLQKGSMLMCVVRTQSPVRHSSWRTVYFSVKNKRVWKPHIVFCE